MYAASPKSIVLAGLAALLFGVLSGCRDLPPLVIEESVDLERFMGDWYVIASIPTFLEKEAWHAVESYRLDEQGRVQTTFRFRKGGPEGPEKVYHPKAVIRDTESNAVWGMRFIWPFRADFRIAWLDETYSTTIIAREKRDYVWIMAREPVLSAPVYEMLVDKVRAMGYDTNLLRKVPQAGAGQ